MKTTELLDAMIASADVAIAAVTRTSQLQAIYAQAVAEGRTGLTDAEIAIVRGHAEQAVDTLHNEVSKGTPR